MNDTLNFNEKVLATAQRCEKENLRMVIRGYVTEAGDMYDFGITFPGAAGYPAKLAEQEKWLRAFLESEAEWPTYWEGKRDDVLAVLRAELESHTTKQAAFAKREPSDQPPPEFHNSGVDKAGGVFVCNCNQYLKVLRRVGEVTKPRSFKEQVMSHSPIGSSFCFRLKLAQSKFSELWVGDECIIAVQ